ncbi:MAG TPA: double-strand break repair helicase AddA [Rhodospirillales bacterium]|nr:double-strand break repair helicase AddA [Rhodospirillales bacterium]
MTATAKRLVAAQGKTRAASDPTASVWVAANAGTGKTHVLIERIARLLVTGTAPGRILCLTFTKAAAAEMENRLYKRLGHWAMAPDGALDTQLEALLGHPATPEMLARARCLFALTLEVPDGLKIRTLHAFCESLLGRFPLEAAVAPHFSVIDERTAAELRHEARDRLLSHAFDGDAADIAEALGHLAGLVNEENFARVMTELDSGRGRLARLCERHGGVGGMVAAARRLLGLTPDVSRSTVIADASAPGAFDELGLHRAVAALDYGTAKDKERAEVLRAWLDDAESRADSLLGAYANAFLTKEDAPRATRSLMTQRAIATNAEALDAMLAEQARLIAIKERLRAVDVAESTGALLAVGCRLLESYEDMKRNRALLDYDDLTGKARRLLEAEGRAAWVHYKLDGGIDHILVDEAQDTSPEQWAVVAALAGEFFAGQGVRQGARTVFAVGDEKQSIYSFQGADPDAFEDMRAHFAGCAGEAGESFHSIELAASHRSVPALLGTVDRVFSATEARRGLTVGEAPIHHESFRQGQAGLVELWPVVTPEEAPDADPWDVPLDQMSAKSPPARLAARIADYIDGWLKGGEILEAAGRPIQPGDIMILVRTRSRFAEEMVRCLKQRRIPVAGSDRMVLVEQMAVMDLLALGNFVLLPDDDLTLAVVLKGPLIGFDEDALFDLAHRRDGSLWEALQGRRSESRRLEAAHRELADLLNKADFTPPYEFFAELLGTGGGRRKLLARLGPDAADPIDELLSLALGFERDHVASLQGFMHWILAGETQIKRDLEHGRNEVRVMTVHGAKGLQSNVVFLPDTCTVPDPRFDPMLLWAEGGLAPAVLWPARRADETTPCGDLREEARRRSEGEYRRLLYVAMTRTRDRLYIGGWEGKRGRDAGCWYDLVEPAVDAKAETVELAWGGSGLRVSDAQRAAPGEEPLTPPAADAGQGVPDWALKPPPAEPTPPRPLVPSRPTDDEPLVVSPLGACAGARFQRGLLIHRLLQGLPNLPPEARAGAARAYLARPVHGLTLTAQEKIAAETLAVLENPGFAELFGPESLAEVPLTGVVSGQVVSGQIDRLLVADEAVTVVDYKTNRPPPESADAVPALYLRQMAAYREVLCLIYPGRPVRCVLLWTDGPRLMELGDALLDPHVP